MAYHDRATDWRAPLEPAALDEGPFAGNLRVGYPRGTRPTAVISVAIQEGLLEELLRVGYSGNVGDEKIVRIEASEQLIKHPATLKAVEATARMPHSTLASS